MDQHDSGVLTAFHPTVEKALEELPDRSGRNAFWERTPKSGKQVSARIGRYGPIVQIGSADDEEKPRYASMKKDQLIATITLDEALALFRASAHAGRAGRQRGGRINREVRPLHPLRRQNSPRCPERTTPTVTLERAVELIHEKESAAKASKEPIKVFDAEPEIKVLNGRYGPYIASGGKNYRIPKDTDPATLTLEQVRDIMAKSKKKGPKPKADTIRQRGCTWKRAASRITVHRGSRRCQLMPAQVIRHTGPRRTHRILAFGPVGGTNFAVLFEVLECIDHADDFIDTAPQWQVVDDHMPYDTALVDKEKPAEATGAPPSNRSSSSSPDRYSPPRTP